MSLMDIQTALIVIAIVIIAFASLLFVYKFGIKEKSYEEALAEQRQQNNALLTTGVRSKSKEKKNKKTSKKLKEKYPRLNCGETETAEDSENTESSSHKVTHHVEFQEPTEKESPDEPVPVALPNKKPVKREKVRPILIKNKSSENLVAEDVVEVPPANHFEELHPKDEFELMHSVNKEDATKQELPKEKTKKEEVNNQEAVKEKLIKNKNVSETEATKSNKKITKQQPQQQQITQPSQSVPEMDDVELVQRIHTDEIVTNMGKEKKKKKSEFNSLQQLAGDKQGFNLPVLLNVVRKAEMTRSEVQILIDLLLNKQHEAPTVLDEWSEGKSDPIQRLKKQLAEKEKALVEEQEALVGAQAKLREIRAEQTVEKSQLQQRARNLEENLQAKQLELQAANNRIHGHTQKIQQLQSQISDEIMNNHKIREEHGTLQLQLELRTAQIQEMESLVVKLRNEIKELSTNNADLHSLKEKSRTEREHEQTYFAQLKHQLVSYQKDMEQKNEINKKLEDMRADLEHRLDVAHHQENELNQEISRLKTIYQQQTEEVKRLGHAELVVVRLQTEVQTLKEEKFKLLEEKAQLQSAHANSSVEENKAHQVEILNLHNELASVKTQLQQTEKKYISELDTTKSVISKLQNELDEQRIKNNELRQKNWKVMEALKAAENRNNSVNIKEVDLNSAVQKVREEEKEITRNLFRRLFPEIKELCNIPQSVFYVHVEKEITNYINKIKQESKEVKTVKQDPETNKLQSQIHAYEKIIVDTDSTLNNLQRYIEQEEIGWRKELKAREKEIADLKEHLKQVQTNIIFMEKQLNDERKERINLATELELVRKCTSQNGEAKFTIDKLSKTNEVSVIDLKNHMSTNGSSPLQSGGGVISSKTNVTEQNLLT